MANHYILMLICFGCLVLLTAWLPMLLREAPLSLPIVCVAVGTSSFAFPIGPYVPDTTAALPFVERITELVVIIALMGAGLKIDRKLAWQSWGHYMAAPRHRYADHHPCFVPSRAKSSKPWHRHVFAIGGVLGTYRPSPCE